MRRNLNRGPIDWDALPLLLTETQTAMAVGVSVSFLQKARTQGTLRNETVPPPFCRVGGRIYYRLHDVKRWVDELSAQQTVGSEAGGAV